jgi:F-type H+-transporting ATPase subunit epsilon
MTTPFDTMVVTPEEVIFHGKLLSIIAPGQMGYFQVLNRHAPMIAMLRHGKLTLLDTDHRKHEYEVTGGYVEISNNEVEVLIDSVLT